MKTQTEVDSKLLPCPFCGGEAKVEREGTRRRSCIVACGMCGARVESNERGSGDAWNKRAAAPRPSSPGADGYAHPFGEPPHPEDAPVLVLYDMDLGWIVEAVVDGEYEVQNMPYMEKNEEPDFSLAAEEAKKRNTFVQYYPE